MIIIAPGIPTDFECNRHSRRNGDSISVLSVLIPAAYRIVAAVDYFLEVAFRVERLGRAGVHADSIFDVEPCV